MTRWNEDAFDPSLPAEMVLRQAEIGVVVTDRRSNIRFVNEYVTRLLRLPGGVSRLPGQPIHALGFIPDGDLPKAEDLTRQVLGGALWEAPSAGTRGDGPLGRLRVLYGPSMDE